MSDAFGALARRLRLPAILATVVAGLALTGVAAGAEPGISTPTRAVPAHPSPASDGTLGPAARRAIGQGYLVLHQRAYERAKARAAGPDEGRAVAPAALGPSAPSTVESWTGLSEDDVAPSDSTGAVGTTTFIELVNSQVAIYSKSSITPLATGTLNELAGVSASNAVFDPQVIWDPTTNRFYYAMDDVVSASTNRLAFGFSKTASPDTVSDADWCRYRLNFGSQFPDYPKLGDSRDFALVGANVFLGNSFLGSDLLAIDKPPSGQSCPTSLDVASKAPLLTNSSTQAFTPVPANEIDTKGTGWAIARPAPTPAKKLSLFKVTRKDNGDAKIQKTATNLSVNQYDVPPNAPQQGSSDLLDTLDARLTQAVAGVDPFHGGKLAVWTQHTIEGGARSKVRWYEIDPAGPGLIQSGSASDASLYEFNGAISPNRAVNGSSKAGGDNMLMGFNTSSAASFPAIKMVSKQQDSAQSAQVLVTQSPGPLAGFDCSGPSAPCRWGDYAAATPDPSDQSRIWSVSQWASGATPTCPGAGCVATWETLNFIASP